MESRLAKKSLMYEVIKKLSYIMLAMQVFIPVYWIAKMSKVVVMNPQPLPNG